MEENKKIVTIELTDEQYAFLSKWQKTHEQELGIEVPLNSMIRKAIDGAMKAQNKPEREGFAPRGDKPSFGGDRPPRRDGPSSGGRPSFGDRPRPSFGGDRPSRGPKFSTLSGGKKRF